MNSKRMTMLIICSFVQLTMYNHLSARDIPTHEDYHSGTNQHYNYNHNYNHNDYHGGTNQYYNRDSYHGGTNQYYNRDNYYHQNYHQNAVPYGGYYYESTPSYIPDQGSQPGMSDDSNQIFEEDER